MFITVCYTIMRELPEEPHRDEDGGISGRA